MTIKSFLGKSKSQVMAISGNQQNDYSSDVWEYIFNKGWWFMQKQVIIKIYFENDKVVFIKKYYRNIETKVSYIHKKY